MRRRVPNWILAVTATVAVCAPEAGAQTAATRAELRAQRVTQPPVVDGILDDVAWSGAPLETGDWLSYNPLHGDTIPQTTRVWIAYDADYIYFAFQCDDPRSLGNQDVDHAARQHLVRRLGRRQPRCARHRDRSHIT